MLKIEVDSYDEISDFLKYEKDIFYKQIVKSIKNSWKNNLDKAKVAEFIVNNIESVINIDIDRDDWEESLHYALYYYEGVEEYEQCSNVNRLISDIYN
jgi:hypothetical protein